ncbi:hypothetical protein ABZS81_23020 [Streptomyces sp. NPDC005318]|uniref:hypothetical protein n=1 Tax=Streptomyces sp. NPDC005318 TaxID=3157031 RepID=UPI0033B3AF0C
MIAKCFATSFVMEKVVSAPRVMRSCLPTCTIAMSRDAPRTTSAADLSLSLNDMDAQAANILLSSGNAGKERLKTPYGKAVAFYGEARRAIGHDLRTLAVAAQGDRTDERTVESLTDNFAEYEELIGRALENDGRTGGKASALADYRRATDLLQLSTASPPTSGRLNFLSRTYGMPAPRFRRQALHPSAPTGRGTGGLRPIRGGDRLGAQVPSGG